MNFFTQLNKKLDEGWKLTDSNCPICKASIIYNPKDKSLFCIKCDKPCIIETEIIDNQEQQESSTKQSSTNQSKKVQNDDEDSDYDEYEFKWNMNKNAPPTRTDEISKLLSQKLLQGYAMLQECCERCLAPIMRSKSGQYTCVGCNWVMTKKEFDEMVENQLNGTQEKTKTEQQQQPKQEQQQPKQQQQVQQQQQQQAKPQDVKQQQVSAVQGQQPQVQQVQIIQDSGEKQKFYNTLQRILNKTADFYEKQIDTYTQQGQIGIVDNIIKTSLKELITAQKQLEQQ